MRSNAMTLLFPVLMLLPFASIAQQLCDSEGAKTMPSERYVIFGDNFFVRDRVTGLEWTRCAIGQAWYGKEKSCKEITKKQVKSWFSYEGAIKEVSIFRKKMHDQQWRLPTINEMLTIVEHRCQQPAINTTIFPNAPSWRFWTGSSMVGNNDYAWVTDFEDGSSQTILKTVASHYIRLVKGKAVKLNKPVTPAEQAKIDIAPWDDGIHDIDNPDLSTLQLYAAATQSMPKDSSGHPDWAKTLNNHYIEPRENRLPEQAGAMVVWQQDIIFKDTATMPWVKFPHKTHSQWLACENCHEDIFNSNGEKADISMGSIYTGQHCGVCHGKIAFNINTCERCHSVMHENVSENGRKMLEGNL